MSLGAVATFGEAWETSVDGIHARSSGGADAESIEASTAPPSTWDLRVERGHSHDLCSSCSARRSNAMTEQKRTIFGVKRPGVGPKAFPVQRGDPQDVMSVSLSPPSVD